MKERKERVIDIIGFFRDLASTTPVEDFEDEKEQDVVFDGEDAEIVAEANTNVRTLENEYVKSLKVEQKTNKKKLTNQAINIENSKVQNIRPSERNIENNDREYGE